MSLLDIDFYSDVLGRNQRMEVILPPGPAPEGGFPTLYLLHGMTDDCTIWLRRSSIERYADARKLAVVMPDGMLGWYADARAGERYFSFVSEELPALALRMLPGLAQTRARRFVGGLSMGGYGALSCALRRPELFSRAISLSGALDAAALPGLDRGQAGARFWADRFGPAEAISGSENDLFRAAEICPGPRPAVWMWCGTEDFLYEMNLRMRDHLQKLGYALDYSECPGEHDWPHWDREIQRALDWLPLGGEGAQWP